MMQAIYKEILLTDPFNDDKIGTIYFGGGTPSLLSAAELKSILDTIRNKFHVDTNAEITLEANPDDIDASSLQLWQQAGINRLSLGIQSFSDAELKWMNRAHNATEALGSIDLIRAAGFTNFSVDLIYGSPLLTNEDLVKNAGIILENNVPHISCYALTVEPKTALDKMISNKISLPVDAEKQAEHFLLLMDLMQQHGYEHYEISNFAKPGMRSRHNSSYWSQTPEGQGKPYYGFGPSAHSFDGKNTRRWNMANNSLYIQSVSKDIIPFEEELLTETQQLNEYIMTSLRTIEGLDLEFVQTRYGSNISAQLKKNSWKYVDSSKMINEREKLTLTAKGKLFADGIAADLFF